MSSLTRTALHYRVRVYDTANHRYDNCDSNKTESCGAQGSQHAWSRIINDLRQSTLCGKYEWVWRLFECYQCDASYRLSLSAIDTRILEHRANNSFSYARSAQRRQKPTLLLYFDSILFCKEPLNDSSNTHSPETYIYVRFDTVFLVCWESISSLPAINYSSHTCSVGN